MALIAFQSNRVCVTATRASKYEKGPTEGGTCTPPKLLRPSSPRFCLSPRSIAPCNDSGSTPGTSFSGTLPAKGLTPLVPGIAWPGVLGLDVVPDCAGQVAAAHSKIPANRNVR